MNVHPVGNAFHSFLKEILRCTKVEELILDRGSWYSDTLQCHGVRVDMGVLERRV
jgi:hypothetical protein